MHLFENWNGINNTKFELNKKRLSVPESLF